MADKVEKLGDVILSFYYDLIAVLPGAVVIAALIAFAATFSGVYLSFLMERRRRGAEERSQFGRIVQFVLVEGANNHAILNIIRQSARPGKAVTCEIPTAALQAALHNPLFHQLADHSLVVAALIVRTQVAEINNVLFMHRLAATSGRGMTVHAVEDLRIRAETVRELLGVMQELLDGTLQKFGMPILADSRTTEINARLKGIVSKGSTRLQEVENMHTREELKQAKWRK